MATFEDFEDFELTAINEEVLIRFKKNNIVINNIICSFFYASGRIAQKKTLPESCNNKKNIFYKL